MDYITSQLFAKVIFSFKTFKSSFLFAQKFGKKYFNSQFTQLPNKHKHLKQYYS